VPTCRRHSINNNNKKEAYSTIDFAFPGTQRINKLWPSRNL
jgi:hypothetical protein